MKVITGNPLLLLWISAGIAAAAGAAGFAGGWTLNGWRLGTQLAECESTAKQFEAANGELNLKITEQNGAMDDLIKKGRTARAAGRQASVAAGMAAQQQAVEISALRLSLAAGTPAGKNCADAWSAIRAWKLP